MMSNSILSLFSKISSLFSSTAERSKFAQCLRQGKFQEAIDLLDSAKHGGIIDSYLADNSCPPAYNVNKLAMIRQAEALLYEAIREAKDLKIHNISTVC